jgi:hypothetical protein
MIAGNEQYRLQTVVDEFMRTFTLYILLSTAVHAADQWQPSLASIGSLRTGGASLVSSDAVALDDGGFALITYWEFRTSRDVNFYRCIDTVNADFASTGQQCWSALRPTGRGPVVIDPARTSNDICGRPDDFFGLSSVEFCVVSEPTVLQTPYFRLMITPFQDGSMVSLSDDGRYLLVSDELPSETFLEVRVTMLDEHAVFAGASSVENLLDLEPENLACEVETTAGRQWASCIALDAPERAIRYTVDDRFIYEISHTSNVPEARIPYLSELVSSFRVRRDDRR